ncbi:FSH1-domain-containing protein [Atractiella rhizophila]|nr:FSH1-domain-containing protein [Atractiella rhizophila]
MLKILMLHGYTQNASVFSKKTGVVRKSVKKGVAEFYYYNAPHVVLTPTFGTDNSQFDSNANTDDDQGPPHYEGFDESVKFIREKNEEVGGFDGVIGFSQGAGFAAMLTSLFLRPSLHPAFSSPTSSSSHLDIAPLKFCILVSGFRSLDPSHQSFFSPSFNYDPDTGRSTEALFILGQNDVIVSPERAQSLVDICREPRVEWHEGSHFVPAKANWRAFYKEYIESFTLPDEEGEERRRDIVGPSRRRVDVLSTEEEGAKL